MDNMSEVTSFILTGYFEMEDLKYLYFTVFFLLYIMTVFANVLLICVICAERSLHEPMYIFLCTLAVNGMYGSTSLVPSVLGQLMSPSHIVSLGCCLAQIYSLHTYIIAEFSVLAVMSYDRYIAICYPLHYHIFMSPRKVCVLAVLSWIYPFVAFGIYFIFTTKLTFCRNLIPKVHCMNFELVRLSCFSTYVHSIVGLVATVFYLVPQILMILFSYVHIFRICLKASKESRAKAAQTCTPHLIAAVNFSVGCFFEVIQSRFDSSRLSFELRLFLSLYYLTFPPLLNPLIYGISVHAIRVQAIKYIFCKK